VATDYVVISNFEHPRANTLGDISVFAWDMGENSTRSKKTALVAAIKPKR
jgi:hypothetical protein